MVEIASREFIDTLTSMLRSYEVNEDVRNKILELIQTWAGAAEGRYNLIYISETYRSLQSQFRFPARENISSSMFDSSAVSLAVPDFTQHR